MFQLWNIIFIGHCIYKYVVHDLGVGCCRSVIIEYFCGRDRGRNLLVFIVQTVLC